MSDNPRIPHLMPPYEEEVEAALSGMQRKHSPVEPLKLFRTMARDLPLVSAMREFGPYMLGRHAAFDMRTREIVIDRVTALCDCEYEWGVHVAGYAKRVGLTEEQIYSIVHGNGSDPCWDAKERAVLDMVDELHETGRVSDAVWDALTDHFNERTLIELPILAGWYHAISYLANSARVEPEDWAPRFPGKR